MADGDADREPESGIALEFLRHNSSLVIAFAALVIMAAAVIYAIYAQRQWETITAQQAERVRLSRAELFAKTPSFSADGAGLSIELANIGQITALAPNADVYERRVAGDKVVEQHHETRQLNNVPSHGGEQSPLGSVTLPNLSPAEAAAIGAGRENVVIAIDVQYRDEIGDRPEYLACWRSQGKNLWTPCPPDLVDDMQAIENPGS